jgi:AbrB family looped-hinge helix DNA binding protein
MATVTISSKYQFVIPREIRKQFNLKPGQKIMFIPLQWNIASYGGSPIKKARGMLKGVNTDNAREQADENR